MPDITLQATPTDGGSKAYSGKGRTGKTTLAVNHVNVESRRTLFPKLVCDLGSVMSFRHLPHAANVDEVLTDLFIKRVDPKIWTPESEDARRKLWRVAHKWGGCHILLDEIWNICDANYVDPELVTLSNQYAHGPLGPVFLYFIGQRVMFINSKLFASIQKWYIFQSAAGGEQTTLRKMFGERVDGNETWPQGKHEEFDRSAAPPTPEKGVVPSDQRSDSSLDSARAVGENGAPRLAESERPGPVADPGMAGKA